jgi:cell wall-associated NlpC family hydrolase
MLRGSVSRKPLIAAVFAALLAAGGWAAVSSSGGEAGPARVAAVAAASRAELPPLPERRAPRAVEPAVGAANQPLNDADEAPAGAASAARVAQQGRAVSAAAARRAQAGRAVELPPPPTAGDGIHDATALPNGIALPPLEAPRAVHQIIEAGNVIARSPYLWGGGHGKWLDTGYDCSGSVSFALAAAGLLDAPLASGPLMSWGEPGPGKWVTIWSNPGHVFMEVAGIRFDTSGQRVTGSRWQNDMRSTAGFVARHPAGL